MGSDERAVGTHPTDELPFYVGGGLDIRDEERVRAHLERCAACREEAAFWVQVARTVRAEDAAVPVPGLRLPKPDRPSTGVPWLIHQLRQVSQLLWAQARVLDRRIWVTSALVLGVGFLVMALGSREDGARWIAAVAPLVAASGIALVEHPRQDPVWELTLATSTSAGLLLLARAAVIFAFDFLVALGATVAVGLETWGVLDSVVLGWLAPMTVLSCLALFLGLLVGPGVAFTTSLLLWGITQLPEEAWMAANGSWMILLRVVELVVLGPWAWLASAASIAAALFLIRREDIQVAGMHD